MFQFKIQYKKYTAIPGIIKEDNNKYKECFKIYKNNIFIVNKIMNITSESSQIIKQYLIDLDEEKINIQMPKAKNINKDTYEIYKNGKLILVKNVDKNYNIKDLIN